MKKSINIIYKAGEGDTVSVKNYRRNGIFESGIINSVKARIYTDRYHISYDIELIRRSSSGRSLFLTVGDRDIIFLHK